MNNSDDNTLRLRRSKRIHKTTKKYNDDLIDVNDDPDDDPDFIIEEYMTDDDSSDSDFSDEEDEEDYKHDADQKEYKTDGKDDDINVIIEQKEEKTKKPIIFFLDDNPIKKLFDNLKKRKPDSEINNTNKKYKDITKKYSKSELEYFNKLNDYEKDEIYSLEKNINNSHSITKEPIRFKLLSLNLSNSIKHFVISKIDQLNDMSGSGSGEYFKLHNWVTTFSRIPLGIYHNIPLTNNDIGISDFLFDVKNTINENIFGHEETKDQIIRILAQWISNPKSNGHVIGIQGPPGVGKTKLVKDGICKAMNYPFSFISLGGISDASYLTGHHYTYEGSTHGKIIECLIKSKVMNPVILFDELDKVSDTSRGQEIINVLIHITDPVQNDKFTDKYFEEIDLDLSKSLLFFTFNDEQTIDPILRDRLHIINVSGYKHDEKLIIAKDYLIPELLPQYNMEKNDISFDNDLIKYLIDNCVKEDGVRNLKRSINDILSWINMTRYLPIDNLKIKLPFIVTLDFYEKYCKKKENKKNENEISLLELPVNQSNSEYSYCPYMFSNFISSLQMLNLRFKNPYRSDELISDDDDDSAMVVEQEAVLKTRPKYIFKTEVGDEELIVYEFDQLKILSPKGNYIFKLKIIL